MSRQRGRHTARILLLVGLAITIVGLALSVRAGGR